MDAKSYFLSFFISLKNDIPEYKNIFTDLCRSSSIEVLTKQPSMSLMLYNHEHIVEAVQAHI